MKKLFAVVTLVLAFSGLGVAQTGAKFSLSGKALGYVAGGSSLIAADAVSAVQISPRLTLRNDNIILSTAASNASIAQFFLGGAQYELPLEKVMSKTFLKPDNYKFYVVGEAGYTNSPASGNLAESFGGGLNYFPSSAPSIGVNLFEVRWLHGKVPVQNSVAGGTQFVSNGIAVSVGLTFK